MLDEVQRLLDANLGMSTADISGFQQVELPGKVVLTAAPA